MKILLAVDGSPHSQDAADEIVRRPWPPGSTIRVVSVVPLPSVPAAEFMLAGATLDQIHGEHLNEANRLTARIADAIRAANLPVDTVVREGDPRSGIVDEAREWSADLIVVGSHGRTGLQRWLLGSVAQAIVAHAPCSVEVVRRPGRRTP